MGVMRGCWGRGLVLVAVEVKQLFRLGTTGLADVMCSVTKHPKTCLLLLMYKYTCMSTKESVNHRMLCSDKDMQPAHKLELAHHHCCA